MGRAAFILLLLTEGAMLLLCGCGDEGEAPKKVIGVVIAEDSLNLEVSHTVEITATVSGGETRALAWYVNDILGGDTTWGTITQTNPSTYRAPDVLPDPATVMVKAVSLEDSTKSDTCWVTIRFTTVHVSVSSGSDETGTGSITKPFKSIARGLSVAQPGMSVKVAEGLYEEHDIMMKSGVKLRSETGDPSSVTIDAKGLGRVFECEYTDTVTTIEGFTITGGNPTGPGYESCGGGVRCKASTYAHINLVNCVFLNNRGGGGGGLACMQYCSAKLTNCVFSGNSSGGYGGAIYYINDNDAAFRNCTFFNNSSASKGGAILCTGNCDLELVNCTFCNNSASQKGGAIYVGMTPNLTLDKTIIAFSTKGEAIYVQEAGSLVVLSCCDLYGNEGGDWVGAIADQVNLSGNFSQDPLFCDMPNGDLRLNHNSPCLPGNHPAGSSCGLIGAWGEGCAH